MNKLVRSCAFASLLVLAGGQAAQADTLDFSYTLTDGNVLGGSLTGSLQADGNTFDVSGDNGLTYNSAALTINPTDFESYSNFYNGIHALDGSGVLTLDGSYANFIDFNSATETGFAVIVNAGFNFSNGADISTVGFSNLGDQPFVASDFSATVDTTAVPEPATAALLCASLVGLTGLRRRRG